INAISVAYLGMKKDRWIEQSELKATVKRAVECAHGKFSTIKNFSNFVA
ncbi:23070_t:CDS:1, partial [Racocetra persica]